MRRCTKFAIALCAAAVAVVAQSCSGAAHHPASDAEADTLAADTAYAEVAEVEAADTVAAPLVANVEEARRLMTEGDSAALYAEGILPRMLDEVPEYAMKLLNDTIGGFIVVDKYRMMVILYDQYGRVRKEYKMACAKNYGTKHKKADGRTPEGFFSVQGIYDSTEWLFVDDDGTVSQVKGQFGPRFIRIATPVTMQIGIHGTCSPWSIGGRRSHGCIRITNDNILELAPLVKPGMPVIVSPGRYDMWVNEEEGYKIPAITTGTTRPTPLAPAKPSAPVATADTAVAAPDTIPAPKASAEPIAKPVEIPDSAASEM